MHTLPASGHPTDPAPTTAAPGQSPGDAGRHLGLRQARERAGLTPNDLWLRYFALGGLAGPVEVEAHLDGLVPLPDEQHDVLVHAVNERLDEQWRASRFPYVRPASAPSAGTRLLHALAELLDGARLAPPERLAPAALAAAAQLGLRADLFLVDSGQTWLRRYGPGDQPGEDLLPVDGSPAGRAYRLLVPVAADEGAEQRLWQPLLDGAERLGVLRLAADRAQDLHGPAMRERCRRLAQLLGHVVLAADRYGDGLDAVRRSPPTEAAAELVRAVLPPSTCATDQVVVSALSSPSESFRGDVYDYAVAETLVDVAVFRAGGHGMAAAVSAVAAVAAYRAARHRGLGVDGQVRGVDETAAGESFAVTGVVCRLDLRSGRLAYAVAGGPAPLLLRGGRVVEQLSGGRRPALGRPGGPASLGEVRLQPGDWVALFSRGVPGSAAGLPGQLEELVERAVGTEQPAPEMVRGLVHGLLDAEEQRDGLSVALLAWSPEAGRRTTLAAQTSTWTDGLQFSRGVSEGT